MCYFKIIIMLLIVPKIALTEVLDQSKWQTDASGDRVYSVDQTDVKRIHAKRLSATTKVPSEYMVYIVKEGDDLIKISEFLYGDRSRAKEINDLNEKIIRVRGLVKNMKLKVKRK